MSADPTIPDLTALARQVLQVEADAILSLIPRIGVDLSDACEICLNCRGRVVVIGMGKSGHIGGKIAATLASTGTPAFFVHPGEASHGDMGMITGDDVVLALSNSGVTPEIEALLPVIKRQQIPLIAMTGKPGSRLARAADVMLDISVAEEACPLNLAPTASTTAALAMGDALAIVLLERRGFKAEDFARTHPGGTLGRRLLIRVGDIMRTGAEIPSVHVDTSVGEGLLEMTRKSLGITAIVDDGNRVLGVFTDGDLRRTLDQRTDVHAVTMRAVMTPGGKRVHPEDRAMAAVELLETHMITALIVVDEEQRLVGALNIHDLFRAGVM